MTSRLRRVLQVAGGALAIAGAGYASYAAAAWWRYGNPSPPREDERDPLLDTFLPAYDVAERHRIRVNAPPDLALQAAIETDMQRSPLVRGIIRTRELALGAEPEQRRATGLLAEMEALGWRVLASVPGREIVAGAVTQPWVANVVFRGLDAERFREFHEPGYVKIAWTLRAEAAGDGTTLFLTETRAVATDPEARRRFRWYWAKFSPGIAVIRRMLLRGLKKDAERLAGRL